MSIGDTVATIVSSGFGSGCSPKAPGTVGSATFLVLWYLLHITGFVQNVLADIFVAGVAAIAGLICVRRSLRSEPVSDPQWIVIDEWAGMAIALIGADWSNWALLLLAFVTFRVFDVRKPGLIGRAERLPGALGVMADDIVGGLFTLGVVQVVATFGVRG